MAPQSKGVRARFFKSPEHGHVVELSLVADPFHSTSIQRVTPEHMERFPAEWDAYEAGLETVDYGGTPLVEVPGIEASMVTAYALKGIHNAEHLADLTDGGLAALGLGARAVRDAARLVIKLKAVGAAKDAEVRVATERRAQETEFDRTVALHRQRVESAEAEAERVKRAASEQAESDAARIKALEAELAARAEGEKADKATKSGKAA